MGYNLLDGRGHSSCIPATGWTHGRAPDHVGLPANGEDAMAFQSVPETAEIVIQYFGNNETFNNVLQARLPGGYVQADLTLLALTVNNAVANDWLPIQTVDAVYIQTLVRGLEFVNDLEAVNGSGTGPGEVLTIGLPGNVTFSVKKGSGLTGRAARGRLYWIGLPAADLQANENLLTIVASDAIEAAVESMRSKITSTVWNAVIVSRFLDGVLRPTGATFNWTTTNAVNINVDSQRRRLQR